MTTETNTTVERCPTCGSTNPNTAASNCYNAWHRGDVVHLQREPIGTPGSQCSTACGAEIDDPPSQLAVDREFVTCRQCQREIYARIADEAAAALGILSDLGDLVRQGKLTPREMPTRDTSSADKMWSDQIKIIRHHQELSDAEINHATADDLRAAYRSLRDHHVVETTALVQGRDDLTRRRDEQLAKRQEILAESQQLLTSADAIMRRDEETIDRLSAENARLTEIVDFMQNRYSPIGGRPCALCVYEDGRFVRSCAMHRWDDILASRATDPENRAMEAPKPVPKPAPMEGGWQSCDRSHAAPPCADPVCYCEVHAHRADKILPGLGDFVRRGVLDPDLWIEIGDEIVPSLRAIRAADPADPEATDYLSDEELAAWAKRSGIYQASMEETYLRFILNELRERRDAEALFAEADRQFQQVDCRVCDDAGADNCEEHRSLLKRWRSTRAALCELARIHRGYLRSIDAPSGGDPR